VQETAMPSDNVLEAEKLYAARRGLIIDFRARISELQAEAARSRRLIAEMRALTSRAAHSRNYSAWWHAKETRTPMV
jgi:hypothetical protein